MQAVVELLIKAANLPAVFRVGIDLEASQDLKIHHVNVHHFSAGAFPNAFTGDDKRSYDGLIWADYRIADSDKNYACRKTIQENGVTASMSRRGNCCDNGVIDSFWHSLKVEMVHRRVFATRSQAEATYSSISRCSTTVSDFTVPSATRRLTSSMPPMIHRRSHDHAGWHHAPPRSSAAEL